MNYATKCYYNGQILTLNANNETVEAVAIIDDQILAVGSMKEVQPYLSPGTAMINLEGKTMCPGFIDPHSHFIATSNVMLGVDLNIYPLGEMHDKNDCIKALQKRAEITPKGDWILGWGYDDTLLKEPGFLLKTDLDKASQDHPIMVLHISGHIMMVNSKAFEIIGWDKNTPNPEGGIIRHDENGELNGVLEELAANQVMFKYRPTPKGEEVYEAYGIVNDHYASNGVTMANEAGGVRTVEVMEKINEAARRRKINIRLIVNPRFTMDKLWPPSTENIFTSNLLTMGAMKLKQDGSLQCYTGYLTKPYYTPFEGNPNHCGYPGMPREKQAEQIIKFHSEGWQIFIHCNGDAAIDDALYGFRKAQEICPRENPRHVIIHAQTARRDQLEEMKRLGCMPSFFSLHTYIWGDRHRDIFLGPERAARISPAHDCIELGMPFTSHIDTYVYRQVPLLSIWAVANRQTISGKILGPEQRVSALEALRSYTSYAAYQYFKEDVLGTIEKGKLADFVILDDNPLTCDVMKIKDINVLETIVGGETVFKK